MVLVEERRRRLLEWYEAAVRDLPWRETSEPWPILVSEVMLQQTQANRVAAAWPEFIGRFPDPESLATAGLGVAIRAWNGLGYQRRVVNLREAARAIVEHGWPTDPAGLERLPGVGPYTAAAVACFAFGHPVPAVDVNHRRVLSRWVGRSLDDRAARRVASTEIDPGHAADWNQAMMDLGAMLCRPRSPRCSDCPVRPLCSDPSVEVSSTRQSRFQGSRRQARAAILHALAVRPTGMTRAELRSEAGPKADEALPDLEREGVIVGIGDHYLLAP